MKRKMADVGEFWEKRELRQSWGKFILFIVLVCIFIYSTIYFVDKYIKANEFTFIKFKINPEFGFVVNGNDEVVYYLSLNDEASDIFTIDMFKELKLEDAVSKFIDIAKKNSYLDEEKNITLTVISDKKSDKKEFENKVISSITSMDNVISLDVVSPSETELDIFSDIKLNQIDVIKERIKNELNNDKVCNYTNVTYDNLSLNDKFNTSVNISNKLYPDGSENLILINANDLLAGYISVSLSSVFDAPILYVETNGMKDVVIEEIKRLSPKNIYVIGGKDVISDKLVSSVKSSFGIEPQRITGKDRYELSINVAKKISDSENIGSVILVSGENDAVNAALISSVSGKLKLPVIYTKNSSLNSDAKEFIKNNKNISSVYVIGDTLNESVINDLKSLGRSVDVIGNNDKYNTNLEIINKFYKYFDSIILVNNLKDMTSGAHYSSKTESVLFYMSDVLSDEQIRIIKNNSNIKNVLYFGDSGIKVVLRDVLFNIKKSNMSRCEKVNNELLFNASKAIFYVSYQGDESVYFGQIITSAIDKLGAENVHVVLFNKGNESNLYKDGTINDDMLLSFDYTDFMSARDSEFKKSLVELGVSVSSYVEELSSVESLSHINNRFDDNTLAKNKIQIKDIMKYYDNLYNSDVTHITYSSFDDNSDHNVLGSVLSELYFDSSLSEKEFENVYLVVKNNATYVTSDKYTLTLGDKNNYSKLLKSINSYKEDLDNNILGIGYKSDSVFFDSIIDEINDKEFETTIHIPYKK